jgi:hypothetical protein
MIVEVLRHLPFKHSKAAASNCCTITIDKHVAKYLIASVIARCGSNGRA